MTVRTDNIYGCKKIFVTRYDDKYESVLPFRFYHIDKKVRLIGSGTSYDFPYHIKIEVWKLTVLINNG